MRLLPIILWDCYINTQQNQELRDNYLIVRGNRAQLDLC